MPPILRSILAIVAGIVVVAALSQVAAWLAWRLAGPGDLPDLLKVILIANALLCVAFVAGGYLTARLAPSAPLLHATVLGVIGTIPTLVGMIAMWSSGQHWYPLVVAGAILSSAVLGGRLYRGRYAIAPMEQGG